MPAATCLWFKPGVAESAVAFYTETFENSRVLSHRHFDNPHMPEHSVDVWSLSIDGAPIDVMGTGNDEHFTMATSLVAKPKDQETLDRYWDAILAAGGEAIDCGWIRDQFGVFWQICPQFFYDVAAGDDDAKAQRVVEAVWTMQKIDLATLQAAAEVPTPSAS